MALGTPVTAAVAYSGSGGGANTVSPAYPSGILATDVVLLIIGQKPATANGGGIGTLTGWTLRESLTGAGGYGNTLQADQGNTNLYFYTWDSPVAGQTGNLSVSLNNNNVAWAFMLRIPTGGGTITYGSADGSRTTAPTSGTAYTVTLTNGTTAPDLKAGDIAVWAMCVPTDVVGTVFSAHTISSSGTTFGTPAEFNEPSSGTGNDIGGYSAWVEATAGSSTAAPTVGATATGTVTNIRGPIVLVRFRELPFIEAEAGSFSYTGQTITDIVGRAINAEAGSFSYTGQNVTLEIDRSFNAEAASFTYTGQNATLAADRDLNAEAGTFSYTGQDAELTYTQAAKFIDAEAGTFSYTGQNATLELARSVNAEAGSFSYTGQNANLAADRSLNSEAGTFAYTGEDADLEAAKNINAEAGSFAYTGEDAAFTATRELNLEAGSFAYTGEDAELIYVAVRQIDAEAGTFDITGQDATLTTTREANAEAGSFAYTGQDATLAIESGFDAGAGSFAYTGQDAGLTRTYEFEAEAGSFAYTGQDATLSKAYFFDLQAGTFNIVGQDAEFARNYAIDAESGSLVYIGQPAGFEAEGAFDAGTFNITGQDASFLRNQIFNAEQTAFGEANPYVDPGYVNPGYVTGLTAALFYGRSFNAGAGSFSYTGQNATLVVSTLYPPESDVLAGVIYGPGGIYVGTYVCPPSAAKQPLYIFDD